MIHCGGYRPGQTYYLCIFAALSKLLHGVGMFYIVHGDGVDHHHSIIFSETIKKKIDVERSMGISDNPLCHDAVCGRLTAAVPRPDLLSARRISRWMSRRSGNEGCPVHLRWRFQSQTLGPERHRHTHTGSLITGTCIRLCWFPWRRITSDRDSN